VGEEEKGKRECWLKGVWLELMGRTNEREKEMIPPLSLKFLGLGLGDRFFFFLCVGNLERKVWESFYLFIFWFPKISSLFVCGITIYLYVNKFLWLEGKANQDQPLNFKNKSQPFI
jgi:hypothetical protein